MTNPAPTVYAKGCDYSYEHPAPEALARAGITFVVRYLNPGTGPGKELTPQEMEDLLQLGIVIVPWFEKAANGAIRGAAGGRQDQDTARTLARKLGFDDDTAIGYSCDFNAEPSQMDRFVLPYIDEISKAETPANQPRAAGVARTGFYGGYQQVRDVHSAGLASLLWQTYAWSQGNIHPAAQIYQRLNGVHIGAGVVDLDDAHAYNFGGWGMTLTPQDLAALGDYLCTPAVAGKLAAAILGADVAAGPRPPFENADWWPEGTTPGNESWTIAHQLRDIQEFARGRKYTAPADRPGTAALATSGAAAPQTEETPIAAGIPAPAEFSAPE